MSALKTLLFSSVFVVLLVSAFPENVSAMGKSPSTPPKPSAPTLSREQTIASLSAWFASKQSARYMRSGGCVDVVYSGWEGYPTERCEYRVSNGKTAKVILLKITPDLLATWVVNAAVLAKGSYASRYVNALRDRILEQAGLQYPIAGIVYEDLDGSGKYQAFPFREGITVGRRGFVTGTKVRPTAAQIEDALDPDSAKTLYAARYARLQGTTREEYKSYCRSFPADCPGLDVGSSTGYKTDPIRSANWLSASRLATQAAFSSGSNALLGAWAISNL